MKSNSLKKLKEVMNDRMPIFVGTDGTIVPISDTIAFILNDAKMKKLKAMQTTTNDSYYCLIVAEIEMIDILLKNTIIDLLWNFDQK